MSMFSFSAAIKAETAEGNDYKNRLGDIDKQVEQAIADFKVPGVAIAVVADGEIIKSAGYGVRDVERSLPVTPDTQFSIGSSTKAFTSFVIGSLVDEGKLDWDDPIKEVLPTWETSDAYLTDNGTLRDLLSHRTGLARHELIWLGNPDLTSDELLETLPHLEMGKTFREGFIYNNLMYAIAGVVAEKASGKSWSELVQNRVLDKLEMGNTSLDITDMQESEDFALPYIESESILERVDFNSTMSEAIKPAGAINSTANDMARWLKLLLDKGVHKQLPLIEERTLATIQSPQTVISPYVGDPDSSPMHYGLGWFTKSYRGHYQVQHGGNIEGFTAAVFTYPTEKIGIVVLANTHATMLPHALALDISDKLLGLESRNHTAGFLSRKNANVVTSSEQELQASGKQETVATKLGEYVGEFYHKGYGEIQISEVDGVLELEYKGVVERFSKQQPDRFLSENTHQFALFEDESLTYERDDIGDITSVMVPFDFPKPIRFTKSRERKICLFYCTEKDFK